MTVKFEFSLWLNMDVGDSTLCCLVGEEGCIRFFLCLLHFIVLIIIFCVLCPRFMRFQLFPAVRHNAVICMKQFTVIPQCPIFLFDLLSPFEWGSGFVQINCLKIDKYLCQSIPNGLANKVRFSWPYYCAFCSNTHNFVSGLFFIWSWIVLVIDDSENTY